MIAAADRRKGERRAIPTHATDREYAVLRALEDVIASMREIDDPQNYSEGMVAGLTLARDIVLVGLKGQR